jgi:hypothetical protein
LSIIQVRNSRNQKFRVSSNVYNVIIWSECWFTTFHFILISFQKKIVIFFLRVIFLWSLNFKKVSLSFQLNNYAT